MNIKALIFNPDFESSFLIRQNRIAVAQALYEKYPTPLHLKRIQLANERAVTDILEELEVRNPNIEKRKS